MRDAAAKEITDMTITFDAAAENRIRQGHHNTSRRKALPFAIGAAVAAAIAIGLAVLLSPLASHDTLQIERHSISSIIAEKANIPEDSLSPTQYSIRARHLVVDAQEVSEDATIEDVYSGTEEDKASRLLFQAEATMLMYDPGDGFDSYVAYIDPDERYGAFTAPQDVVFAFDNTQGEMIDGVTYDEDNGLAYIPKEDVESFAYHNEENGIGTCELQAQMLVRYDLEDDAKATVPTFVRTNNREVSYETECSVIQNQISFDTVADLERDALSPSQISVAVNDGALVLNGETNPYSTGSASPSVYYDEESGKAALMNVNPTSIVNLDIRLDTSAPIKAADKSYSYYDAAIYNAGTIINPRDVYTGKYGEAFLRGSSGYNKGERTAAISWFAPGNKEWAWDQINMSSVTTHVLACAYNIKLGACPPTLGESWTVDGEKDWRASCIHARYPNGSSDAIGGGWYKVLDFNPTTQTMTVAFFVTVYTNPAPPQEGAIVVTFSCPSKGRLEFTKSGSANSSIEASPTVVGARYGIWKNREGVGRTDCDYRLETDESGKFSIDLEAGTYYMREIYAPWPYTINMDVITFTIRPNETTRTSQSDGSNPPTTVTKTIVPPAGASTTVPVGSKGEATTEVQDDGKTVVTTFVAKQDISSISAASANSAALSAPTSTQSAGIRAGQCVTFTQQLSDTKGWSPLTRNAGIVSLNVDGTRAITEISMPGKPLVGATYGVYEDQDCSGPIILTIPIESDGTGSFGYEEGQSADVSDGYWIKEETAPAGYSLDLVPMSIPGISGDSVLVNVTDSYSGIVFDKEVEHADFVARYPQYTIAGARYGIFLHAGDAAGHSASDVITLEDGSPGIITIDASGRGSIVGVPDGNYYIAEIPSSVTLSTFSAYMASPLHAMAADPLAANPLLDPASVKAASASGTPNGKFLMDEKIYPITISGNKLSGGFTSKEDIPVRIRVSKESTRGDLTHLPQFSLEGAVFGIYETYEDAAAARIRHYSDDDVDLKLGTVALVYGRADGSTTLTDPLPLKDYYVREIRVPDNYEATEGSYWSCNGQTTSSEIFKISEDDFKDRGSFEGGILTSPALVRVNKPVDVTVTVTKKADSVPASEKINGSALSLEGARFALYRSYSDAVADANRLSFEVDEGDPNILVTKPDGTSNTAVNVSPEECFWAREIEQPHVHEADPFQDAKNLAGSMYYLDPEPIKVTYPSKQPALTSSKPDRVKPVEIKISKFANAIDEDGHNLYLEENEAYGPDSLEGALFALYETQDEANSSPVTDDPGDFSVESKAYAEGAISVVRTASGGACKMIEDLPWKSGGYWIVEIKAPTSGCYERNSIAVPVTVDKNAEEGKHLRVSVSPEKVTVEIDVDDLPIYYYVKIEKTTEDTSLLANPLKYDLAGVHFGIYKTKEEADVATGDDPGTPMYNLFMKKVTHNDGSIHYEAVTGVTGPGTFWAKELATEDHMPVGFQVLGKSIMVEAKPGTVPVYEKTPIIPENSAFTIPPAFKTAAQIHDEKAGIPSSAASYADVAVNHEDISESYADVSASNTDALADHEDVLASEDDGKLDLVAETENAQARGSASLSAMLRAQVVPTYFSLPVVGTDSMLMGNDAFAALKGAQREVTFAGSDGSEHVMVASANVAREIEDDPFSYDGIEEKLIDDEIIQDAPDEAKESSSASPYEYIYRVLALGGDDALFSDYDVIAEHFGQRLLGFSSLEDAMRAVSELEGRTEFAVLDTELTIKSLDDMSDEEIIADMFEHDTPATPDPVELDQVTVPDTTVSFDENPLMALRYVPFGAKAQKSGKTIALIDTGCPLRAYVSDGAEPLNVVESISLIGHDDTDENGHATDMGNIIASLSPDASILAIKALDERGLGTISSVYAAIEYAISKDVDIINLSFAAKAVEENAALASVIKKANDAGTKIFAAAGNNRAPADIYTPANIDECITVGYLDDELALGDLSNYGDKVDLYVKGASTSAATAAASALATLVSDEREITAEAIAEMRPDAARLPGADLTRDDDYARMLASAQEESNEALFKACTNSFTLSSSFTGLSIHEGSGKAEFLGGPTVSGTGMSVYTSDFGTGAGTTVTYRYNCYDDNGTGNKLFKDKVSLPYVGSGTVNSLSYNYSDTFYGIANRFTHHIALAIYYSSGAFWDWRQTACDFYPQLDIAYYYTDAYGSNKKLTSLGHTKLMGQQVSLASAPSSSSIPGYIVTGWKTSDGSKTYNLSQKVGPWDWNLCSQLTYHRFREDAYLFSESAPTKRIGITNPYAYGDGAYIGPQVVNLYAVMTPETYRVYFDENGGDYCSMSSKTVTYGSTYGTLASTYREGYAFNGWYTSRYGGSRVYSTSTYTATENTTLYAHWTPLDYDAYFTATDPNTSIKPAMTGSGKTISSISINSYFTVPECDYNKFGYRFLYWSYTDANGYAKTASPGDSLVNVRTDGTSVTFTATWARNAYIARYNSGLQSSWGVQPKMDTGWSDNYTQMLSYDNRGVTPAYSDQLEPVHYSHPYFLFMYWKGDPGFDTTRSKVFEDNQKVVNLAVPTPTTSPTTSVGPTINFTGVWVPNIDTGADCEANVIYDMPLGEITIQKAISSDATATVPTSCSDLSGIRIGLYSDAACTHLIESKLTDARGLVSFTGQDAEGTYWAREMEIPASLRDAMTLNPTPVEVHVSTSSNAWSYSIDNELLSYDIEVTKKPDRSTVSKVSEDALSMHTPYGAVFALYESAADARADRNRVKFLDSAGSLVTTATATAPKVIDGVTCYTAMMKGLELRTYYVMEIGMPNNGYDDWFSDGQPIEVNPAGNGQVAHVTKENTLHLGRIDITKEIDASDLAALNATQRAWVGSAKLTDGIVYGVYTDLASAKALTDDTIAELVIENGRASAVNLPYGKYYIVEKDIPDAAEAAGIRGSSEIFECTIDDSQNTIARSFSDEFEAVDIHLSKVDADDGSPIAGVIFDVYLKGTFTPVTTIGPTGADGTAKSAEKVLGNMEYDIRERWDSMPDAYTGGGLGTNTAWNGTIRSTEQGRTATSPVTVENKKNDERGNIEIVKASNTGAPAAGARFAIYRENMFYDYIDIADGKGEMRDVPIGNYSAIEAIPLTGHSAGDGKGALGELVKFEGVVLPGGTWKVNDGQAIENYQGYIRVKKESADPAVSASNPEKYSLEGAMFAIYPIENGVVSNSPIGESLYTQSDGESNVVAVPCGRYCVKEIKEPDNYLTDPNLKEMDVDVTSDASTEARAVVLTFSDTPAYDELDFAITKRSLETQGSGGVPQGATTTARTRFEVTYSKETTEDPAVANELPVERRWILESGDDGTARMDEEHLVGGDALYESSKGERILPAGTIVVREIRPPDGYTLGNSAPQVYSYSPEEGGYLCLTEGASSDVRTAQLPHLLAYNSIHRMDLSFDKVSASDPTRKMTDVPFVLQLLDAGGNPIEQHLLATDANGHFDSSAGTFPANVNDSWIPGSSTEGTVSSSFAPSSSRIWFTGTSAPVSEGMGRGSLIYGDYVLYELRRPDLLFYQPLPPIRFSVGADDGGAYLECDGKRSYDGNLTDVMGAIENHALDITGTDAVDGHTGLKVGALGEPEIIDRVSYRDAVPGDEYTLVSYAYYADTKEALSREDREFETDIEVLASGAATFTPTASEGIEEVNISLEGFDIESRTIAIKTVAYSGAELIFTHNDDLADPLEQVNFPKIGTTATDAVTGRHDGANADVIVIKDTVRYENLVTGQEYEMSGTIMNKATREPVVDVHGEIVRSSGKFTPDEPDGTFEITFEFEPAGGELTCVAYEELLCEGVVIAEHEDIEDEDQTVEYPSIGTVAIDETTGIQYGPAEADETSIKDTIRYANLQEGSYTIRGRLYDKTEDKLLVDESGEGFEGAIEVTIGQDDPHDGYLVMSFEDIPFDLVEGHEIVVFEVLYDRDENMIVDHEDPEDEAQTVHYVITSTSAIDHKTACQVGSAYGDGSIMVEDTVRLDNLSSDGITRAKVVGFVCDPESGEALLDAGGQVISSCAFFDMSIGAPEGVMRFEIPVGIVEPGQTIVIKEYVYVEDPNAVYDDGDGDGNDEGDGAGADEGTGEEEGAAADEADMAVEGADSDPVARDADADADVDGDVDENDSNAGEGADGAGDGADDDADDGSDEADPEIGAGDSEDATTGDEDPEDAGIPEEDRQYICISKHDDAQDPAQQVHYPIIWTRAFGHDLWSEDASAEIKNVPGNSETPLLDTIMYENLVPGIEYTIESKFMDESGEVARDDEGAEIVASTTFTPEEPDGEITVDFGIHSMVDSQFKDLVAFEKIYTEHRWMEDITPEPDGDGTGDEPADGDGEDSPGGDVAGDVGDEGVEPGEDPESGDVASEKVYEERSEMALVALHEDLGDESQTVFIDARSDVADDLINTGIGDTGDAPVELLPLGMIFAIVASATGIFAWRRKKMRL